MTAEHNLIPLPPNASPSNIEQDTVATDAEDLKSYGLDPALTYFLNVTGFYHAVNLSIATWETPISSNKFQYR
jgi:hypothetical protein